MPAVAYDPETSIVYENYGGSVRGYPVDIGLASQFAGLPTLERYNAQSVAAPAPAAPAVSPVGGAAPGVTPAVSALLAKRDAVMGPLQLASGSRATSVQKGVAPEILNPILDQNAQSAETLAAATEQAGAATADRRSSAAMADATQAFGRHQVATGEADVARQRGEIARLNQAALAAQTDPEVNPTRYVESMSTGRSIAHILLAALNGAFKGATGQQGNDVMDLFRERVAQDIASQKEQIASGRIRRANLIQYFQDQGMREDAAEKAAEAVAFSMLDRMAAAEAERINSEEARTNAALISAQIRDQVTQSNNQLRLTLGTDRTTEQSAQSFARPAPTGGGAGDAMKREKEAQELVSIWEKNGYTKDEIASKLKTLGMSAPGGQSAAELDREAKAGGAANSEQGRKARAAVEQVQQIGNELSGLPQDKVWKPEARLFITRAANGVVDAIFGEDTWRQAFVSEEERNAARTFALAKQQLLSASSVMMQQGALGDQERKFALDSIQAANSPKELRAAADQVLRLAQAGERGISGKQSGQGPIASEAR